MEAEAEMSEGIYHRYQGLLRQVAQMHELSSDHRDTAVQAALGALFFATELVERVGIDDADGALDAEPWWLDKVNTLTATDLREGSLVGEMAALSLNAVTLFMEVFVQLSDEELRERLEKTAFFLKEGALADALEDRRPTEYTGSTRSSCSNGRYAGSARCGAIR